MLVILAKNLSSDQVLERLQEDINLYKEAELFNKDVVQAKHQLITACHMFIIHHLSENASDIIKEMHQIEKNNQFFKTTEN